MYRLEINFLSDRGDASQRDTTNVSPTPRKHHVFLKVGYSQIVQLVQRISKATRAKINSLLSKLKAYKDKNQNRKNPEWILEQSIMEMQKELVQLRKVVAKENFAQIRIWNQYCQAQTGTKWQQSDRSALEQDDEAGFLPVVQINFLRGRRGEQLGAEDGQDADSTRNSASVNVRGDSKNPAHKTPIRQKTNPEAVSVLKVQLDQQTALVEKLKRDLIVREAKISEAKTQKGLLKQQVAAVKTTEQIQNQEMLRQFFEAPCESLIRRLEQALAAQTVQRIEVRLRSRLQAVVVLICWNEELAIWKFHLLYRLILDQQEDLSQLRQLVDRAVVERVIEACAAQKLNQLQYRQIQRVAIRCQERAQLSLKRGNENWALECLSRKNSVMKMASKLKAKLDEQTPIVDELRSKLSELENQIADDEQTPIVDEIKRQLNELENQIAEFCTLYRSVFDLFKIKEPESNLRLGALLFRGCRESVFHVVSFVSALSPTQVNQQRDRYSLNIKEPKFKVWLEALSFRRCREFVFHMLSLVRASSPTQVNESSDDDSLNINFLADRFLEGNNSLT